MRDAGPSGGRTGALVGGLFDGLGRGRWRIEVLLAEESGASQTGEYRALVRIAFLVFHDGIAFGESPLDLLPFLQVGPESQTLLTGPPVECIYGLRARLGPGQRWRLWQSCIERV